MSSEQEVQNQSRPNTGQLRLSNIAKHGIISLTLVLLLSPAIPPAAAQPSPDGSNNQYPYTNFSPSMAIIIVVLIAALFFMGFFSIYIRHCTESRAGSIRPVAGVATGRSRRGMRGLEPSMLEKFPTLVYAEIKNHKIGKSTLECAVCLNEFEDDETLKLLPKCDHVFHPDCIDAWLSSHTTCPVCRANLAIPADGDTTGEYILPHETQSDSDESTHRPEADELQNSVSIRIVEDQNGDQALLSGPPEAIKPSRSFNQSRTTRSRSIKARIFSKFPRSHSTGHSLIQPGENVERFTLRLPEEVRKQIVNRKLNRATSLVVLPREGSSRRGYRTGGEGSSRGKKLLERLATDRWVFSMTPPFLTRASSIRSPRVAADNGSIRSPRVLANNGSIRFPRVVANDGEGTSSMPPPAKGLNAV